jgi:hypothetical protein
MLTSVLHVVWRIWKQLFHSDVCIYFQEPKSSWDHRIRGLRPMPGNWICFRCQVKGWETSNLLDPLETANRNHPIRQVMFSRIPEEGKSPAILSAIHHWQNPSDSLHGSCSNLVFSFLYPLLRNFRNWVVRTGPMFQTPDHCTNNICGIFMQLLRRGIRTIFYGDNEISSDLINNERKEK